MMKLPQSMTGNRPTLSGIGLAFAAGVMTFSNPAGAQTAPVVQAASSANSNGGPVDRYVHEVITASGTYTTTSEGTNTNPGYEAHGIGSNSVTIDTAARSIVSSSQAAGFGFSPASANSVSQITYYFTVSGPTPTVAIDISAIATLARSAYTYSLNVNEPGPTQGQYVDLLLLDDQRHGLIGGVIQTGFPSYLRDSTVFAAGMFSNPGAVTTPMSEAYSQTFEGLKSGTIDTGRLYSIRMILGDNVDLGSYVRDTDRQISSYASLSDLNVSINSAFASADYQIDFGGDSMVPEPESWAMFIGGFGLIGGAMRRRQGSPATA